MRPSAPGSAPGAWWAGSGLPLPFVALRRPYTASSSNWRWVVARVRARGATSADSSPIEVPVAAHVAASTFLIRFVAFWSTTIPEYNNTLPTRCHWVPFHRCQPCHPVDVVVCGAGVVGAACAHTWRCAARA